jgi:hypothetical protein
MRALIMTLALLCAFAPAPAHAQSLERAEYDLRQVGAWAERASAINTRIVVALQSIDSLTQIMNAYTAGEKSQDWALAEVEAWRGAFARTMAALRADVAALPPVPTLSEPMQGVQTLLEALASRMPAALDESERFAETMIEMTLSAVRGEADETVVSIQQVALVARRLTEFENESLMLMSALSPPDHPNRNLGATRIAMNNASLVLLDVVFASASAETVSFPDEKRAEMRSGVETMRREIGEGRRVLAALRRNTTGADVGLSPQVRTSLDGVFDSVGESFDTLGAGADILQRAANTPQDAKVDQLLYLLDELAAIDVELLAQNTERARLIATPAPTL